MPVNRSFSSTAGLFDRVGYGLEVEVNDSQSADVSTLYDSPDNNRKNQLMSFLEAVLRFNST